MNTALPFTIHEVGPRDGLQFEKIALNVEEKLALIDKLAHAGARHIEAGSFVRADKVPSMAGSDAVAQELKRRQAAGHYQNVQFAFLTLNAKGAEKALETVDAGFGELATVVAVSDAFCKANMGVESLDAAFTQLVEPVLALAKANNVRVRGYISTIFEGQHHEPIAPEAVAKAAKRYLDMGAYEVSLGDTTGAGTPETTTALMDALEKEALPFDKIAMHLHDTGGRAIDNVAASFARGIRIFDAAAGGLGGCPFANSPKGNLATETLLAFCSDHGIDTGLRMDDLVRAADFALKKVHKQSPSLTHCQVAARLGL